MEITINTPALLFPATSLLMISYTTRFLHIANLIRNLHPLEPGEPKEIVFRQIANLRRRIRLIRNMQAAGVTSLLLCVVCMFLLFGSQIFLAQVCFAISLVFMIASLVLSLWEIWISVDAVNLHLVAFKEVRRDNTSLPAGWSGAARRLRTLNGSLRSDQPSASARATEGETPSASRNAMTV
jgi:lysylphosphatidylglycerol synthetase-like protein (DUF2156 family)